MVLSGVKKFESVQILRLSLTPLSAANGRNDVTPAASDVAAPTTPTSAIQKESVSVEAKRAQFVMTSSKQAAVAASGKRSGRRLAASFIIVSQSFRELHLRP